MTYFHILLIFILPPLLVLAAWAVRWERRRTDARVEWLPYRLALLHVILALLYTTPWDNYLVATGVWWYNPALVSGLRLWYVPIEEYTFFILQTLIAALFYLWLLRRSRAVTKDALPPAAVRGWPLLAAAAAWLLSVTLFITGWQPGRYLALILGWALIPVMLQLGFGADILLARWRLLTAAILLPTAYLWGVDALALGYGTWSIDPRQTTGLALGILPLEEMVFFMMTNVLVVFGMHLMLSPQSHARARRMLARVRATEEPGA